MAQTLGYDLSLPEIKTAQLNCPENSSCSGFGDIPIGKERDWSSLKCSLSHLGFQSAIPLDLLDREELVAYARLLEKLLIRQSYNSRKSYENKTDAVSKGSVTEYVILGLGFPPTRHVKLKCFLLYLSSIIFL